ncbi:hypothetical protein TorRG33x02_335300, partial [Trema orientale]
TPVALQVEKQALRRSNSMSFSGNNSSSSQIGANKETGYRQADCKKSGKKALFGEPKEVKDDVEIGEEPTFDDYGEMVEKELVEGDTGPLLMLQHSCLTPQIMEEKIKNLGLVTVARKRGKC